MGLRSKTLKFLLMLVVSAVGRSSFAQVQYRQIQQPLPVYTGVQGGQLSPLPNMHPLYQVPSQSIFQVNPTPIPTWQNQNPMLATSSMYSKLVFAPGWSNGQIRRFNQNQYFMPLNSLMSSPLLTMAMVMARQQAYNNKLKAARQAIRERSRERRAERRVRRHHRDRFDDFYGIGLMARRQVDIAASGQVSDKGGSFSLSIKAGKDTGGQTSVDVSGQASTGQSSTDSDGMTSTTTNPVSDTNAADTVPVSVTGGSSSTQNFSPNSFMDILQGKGLFTKNKFMCEKASINQCENISPDLASVSPAKFSEIKDETKRRDEFVEWLRPALQHWGMITGIPPSLIAAQAVVESGAGSSRRFKDDHNLFSIYCGKIGDIETSIGHFKVEEISCNGTAEAGHSGAMTTPKDFDHALKYYLAYLTSKMKRVYPDLDEEVKKAKAKGPLEMAKTDDLLKVQGYETVKCGGKFVKRPKYALTAYACDPNYRDHLASVAGKYKNLDANACHDCLDEKIKNGSSAPSSTPSSIVETQTAAK